MQVLHNLSMWSAKDKVMTYDQAKADAKNARKDMKLVMMLYDIILPGMKKQTCVCCFTSLLVAGMYLSE